MPHGTWQTTGGGDGAVKVIAVTAGIGALAYLGSRAASGAARMAGEYIVVGAAVLFGMAAGVVVAVAVVRVRGHRRAAPAGRPEPAVMWRPNPRALPPREARAIAPAPVVNVNIDAGLLAGLMEAARRQPAPVIVQAETEELPR